MRKYFFGFLLTVGLFSFFNHATAQTVNHFTRQDFTKNGELMLFLKGGWEYKKQGGNNWQKIDPLKLDESIANEKGEIDGWLRYYFTIDSSIANEPLFIRFTYFGAASVFINGQLIYKQGLNFLGKLYDYEKIKPFATKQNCLLIHIKDRKLGFPAYAYQQDFNSSKINTVRFVNNHHARYINTMLDKIAFFYHLWIIGLAIFSVLFGILYFVNKRNTNLFYITLSNTLLSVAIYLLYVSNMKEITFNDFVLYQYIFRPIFWSYILVLVITIFKLVNVPFTELIRIILALIVIASIVQIFIDNINLFTAIMLFTFIFIIYQVIKRIRLIKGAQWFVLAGLLAVIFFLIIFNVSVGIFEIDVNSNFSLSMGTGVALSFPISLFFYLAFRFREINQEVVDNANQVVQLSEEKRIQAENQQKILEEEVAKQTVELRNSLYELKSTQSQLIQSEKMASLGELTAGIAHEIQNPLNFVNNFSELNVELMAELRVKNEELGIKNEDINDLVSDIQSNSEKINHHGQRAASIVKGMLQHSRSSSATKELTDINALCDEYLRLAYHGLRAKDKSFNAAFKTEFDESIPKVNIVPQDMGRVVLNLINNAFFAVKQRQDVGTSERQDVRTSERQNGSDDPTIRRKLHSIGNSKHQDPR